MPPLILGNALIDTGSTVSGVDQRILDQLGLPAIEARTISTPLGASVQGAYPAQIKFTEADLPDLISDDWVGLDLERGLGAIALLGRNALAKWTLVYDGPTGTITITG